MSAYCPSRPSPMNLGFFLILLVVVGLVLVVLAGALGEAPASQHTLDVQVPALVDAPLTQHAALSHLGQWNATNIQGRMRNGLCHPIYTYLCPEVEQIKLLCHVHDDLWVGLIIGTADPKGEVIITGYAAPWRYWSAANRRDNCVLTGGGY